MKIYTHGHTQKIKNRRFGIFVFTFCTILLFGAFILGAFACFYYAQSIIGAITLMIIPVFVSAVLILDIKDVEKAYIEIRENNIYIADYCWGIKKEKYVLFSDITSAEICLAYSPKVKGKRLNTAGTQYIVFRKNGKYLFKIIVSPETKKIFEQYLK